jgi:hypothetical protein
MQQMADRTIQTSQVASDWLELGSLRLILNAVYAGRRDAPDLHRVFLTMSGGSHATAVMLAMVVKWDARMRDRGDGWWYKSDSSWQDEAGLSPYEARTARALLVKCGLRFDSRPALDGRKTWHYALDQDAFWAQFAAALGLPATAIQWCVYTLKTSNGQVKTFEWIVQDIATDPSKILNGTLKKVERTLQQSAEVLQPVSTVTTSEHSTEEQSSSRARAHEGAHDERPETTTTNAPVNMQQMLRETGQGNSGEDPRDLPGNTPDAPEAPPPSSAPPPSPAALAGDALWRAYVAGGGVDAVPLKAFGLYAGAWRRLADAGASAEEVERMTRDKLDGRAPDKPYRFTFLADDLAEWRRGKRRPVDVMRDEGRRYASGIYASFIQTGAVSQTAQASLGG